jgi:WD40 repeat protein
MRSRIFAAVAVFAIVAMIAAILAMQDARTQRTTAANQRSIIETSRRRFYGAQAALSLQAWETGNIGKARRLLADAAAMGTDGSAPDLRGWEWYFVSGLCDLTDAGNLAIKDLKDAISSIVIVPGYGAPLIAAAVGGTVSMRDLRSGEEVAVWKRGSDVDYGSLAASPDGSTLAFGGIDGHVIVWEVAGGTVVSDTDVGGFVSSIAFSPLGDAVAVTVMDEKTGFNTPEVTIVPRQGGTPRRLLTDQKRVTAFAFSPDRRHIAIATEHGKVTLRDLADAAARSEFPINDLGDRKVTQLSFDVEGNILAAMVSGHVRLIDVAEPAKQWPLSKDQPYATAFSFSHDGRYIATTGDNGAAYVWDTNGKQERVLRGHLAAALAVAFGPDDQVLVTGGNDATIRVWDLRSRPAQKFREFGAGDWIKGLAVSADGLYLAATEPYGKSPAVAIFDATTGRQLRTVPGKVSRTSFAPDHAVLAMPGTEGGVDLIDASDGKTVRSFAGPKIDMKAIQFSPDGRSLVTVPEDGDDSVGAYLWNLETGESRRLKDADWCDSVDFSPDARLIATASTTMNEIDFFRTPDGAPVGRITTRASRFVRFSPNGAVLLSAGAGGTMTLWRVADRRADGELQGHTATVLDAVFSPSGRWLITASADRTIRFWDVAARTELFVMESSAETDSAKTEALAFSAAEDRLFSGNGRSLRFWDAALLAMPPQRLTSVLHRVRGSYFSDLHEWERAVADDTQALALTGTDPSGYDLRGNAYAHLGRWGDAVADFRRAVRLESQAVKVEADQRPRFLDHMAVAGLKLGRHDVYEAGRTALIRRAKQTKSPDDINTAVWVTSLASKQPATSQREIALQRLAVRDSPTDYAIASTLGTILARDGDPDEAVEVLDKAMTLTKDAKGSAFDWISLALAHARAGRVDDARKWLEKVQELRDRLGSDPFYEDPNWSWDSWTDRVELELLQRDATSLIEARTSELDPFSTATSSTSITTTVPATISTRPR